MSFPFMAALSWRAVATEYVSTKTFPTGALGMTEDGSLWRLCKAGAAMTSSLSAKINAYEHLAALTGDTTEAPLATAIAVGDVDYTITDATNSHAANYYKGGYALHPSSTLDNIRYIWKSDAEVSDTFKIHVTAPFTVAAAAGNTIHSYPSPWGNVKGATTSATGGSGYEHFVCIPSIYAITSGYYFWGHVRGPHWCWVAVGVWPGAASEDRHVHFHTNGGIDMLDRGVYAQTSPQIAGYLMYSGNYGDAMIYLQIE